MVSRIEIEGFIADTPPRKSDEISLVLIALLLCDIRDAIKKGNKDQYDLNDTFDTESFKNKMKE